MKKIATLLLLIITLSVHAQKMPSPPKEDAFGKESLWESFERKDTYDILNRTKKNRNPACKFCLFCQKN